MTSELLCREKKVDRVQGLRKFLKSGCARPKIIPTGARYWMDIPYPFSIKGRQISGSGIAHPGPSPL